MSPLYRPVEVIPGVELRPGARGRSAELVIDPLCAGAQRHGDDPARVRRYVLEERALEDLAAAAREALE